MPASSPRETSLSSTFIPRRSAQRISMRSSISAQSCESVPPAPALTVTTASPPSYSPANRRASSSSASRASIDVALLLQLGGDRLVLGRHLLERLEVVDVALERAEALEPPRQRGVLGRHRGRALLVVPEAGRLHLPLELGYARFELERGQR